jgi:hypothetical protein
MTFMDCHRAARFLAVSALLALAVAAQQPNHPNATLAINGNSGPLVPIPASGLQGLITNVQISSVIPGVKPFVLAYGTVIPNYHLIPAGIVDLAFNSCIFDVVFNGFDPAFPINGLSWLGPANNPTFSVTFVVPNNALTPSGFQGAVADPSMPNGVRLTAAADFMAGGPMISSVSPPSASAAGGTIIAINGSNFHCDPPTILFGGIPATQTQVQSSSRVFALLPPNPTITVPTAVSVTVTQLSGTITAPGAFTYTP